MYTKPIYKACIKLERIELPTDTIIALNVPDDAHSAVLIYEPEIQPYLRENGEAGASIMYSLSPDAEEDYGRIPRNWLLIPQLPNRNFRLPIENLTNLKQLRLIATPHEEDEGVGEGEWHEIPAGIIHIEYYQHL